MHLYRPRFPARLSLSFSSLSCDKICLMVSPMPISATWVLCIFLMMSSGSSFEFSMPGIFESGYAYETSEVSMLIVQRPNILSRMLYSLCTLRILSYGIELLRRRKIPLRMTSSSAFIV